MTVLMCASDAGTAETGARAPHGRDKRLLLVSRAGHVREALLSLLKTLPFVGAIDTADSGLLALRNGGEHPPRVVLVAGGLPEAEGPELIRQMRQRWPGTACMVLAENARQYELAQKAGANCVLLARAPSRQMLTAVTALFHAATGELHA